MTDLMRQYYALKAKHRGAILLFQIGDFYETFEEDAKIVSQVLGITLTRRNTGEGPKTYRWRAFPCGRWIPTCLSSSRQATGVAISRSSRSPPQS